MVYNNEGPIYSILSGKPCSGNCKVQWYQDGGGGWDAFENNCPAGCDCVIPGDSGYNDEIRTVNCATV
jgi:hypothetical protein